MTKSFIPDLQLTPNCVLIYISLFVFWPLPPSTLTHSGQMMVTPGPDIKSMFAFIVSGAFITEASLNEIQYL